ncbi:MAG TPA: CPBP family intramembrane glutamic endopeptidase [Anaerolineales bacterium]|nr:CPBP family intramembrane glutamic endopeptidase [Anaerolineales bacterium]
MKQHPLFKSIVLHLLPGALGTLVYVLLAPALLDNGYPALLALLIAVGAITLPFQIVYLLLQRRNADEQPVLGLRESLPKWQYFVFPLVMVIWGFLASGALSLPDVILAESWFGWLPGWFFIFDMDQFKLFSREALMTTFWVGLIVNGFAGPIVEECYFRGHLLPRLSGPRNWVPFINISLFSLYHFWTPWQFFSRILWLMPWGYIAWRKKNFYLMMIAHCTANTLGWLLTWAAVFNQQI